jgi:transcriptional regulator
MTPARNELLHGTLETLILKTLAGGPRHGYAIARWLEDTTGDGLQIEDGSLYPALYRLEAADLIEGKWGTSPEGREAKFYKLTRAGRKRLSEENDYWRVFSTAVDHVLEGA